MKPSYFFVAFALIVLPACSDIGTAPSVERGLEDTRETVFRYQFFNNESGQQQSASVYFVGLYVPGDSVTQGHYVDPSDQLMSRFAGNVPCVKKFSECTTSVYGVIDKQTGAYGLLFRIESIKKISDDEAEVTGGYFEGGLSASGNIYTVKWVNDWWVVAKDVMVWIS
jgi:hypothetical protein